MQGRGVAVAVIGGVVLATLVAGAQGARLVGTKAGNLLVGTNGPDRLLGKGGGDLIKGFGGSDRLSGGKGRDLLNGGRGPDRLVAGPGNDGIKAADGRRDLLINGGGGKNACVVDIPIDLPVTRNCATLQTAPAPGSEGGGSGGGGGGGGVTDPNLLEVTSAQGLLCLPLIGCAFTITGKGADVAAGTVSFGGAITSVTGTAVNDFVLGTWLATGTFSCTPGGTGWLQVTMGTKHTPQIPVTC
jgi:RTX calcium-binding nonapeptide repeat (4 copies)